MQYQTGSATSSTDLVQQLVTWLVGLGWTQDRSAVEGSGWTATLHNNGNFVNLRAVENESAQPWHFNNGSAHYGVHMYLSTAYSSGQPFNNQATGAPIASGGSFPVGVGMQLSAGPFPNYYFFADATADNIVVVVEKTSGLFVFIGWGLSIQKAGAFTGGPYFFGTASGYYTSFTGSGANSPGFTVSSDPPCAGRDATPRTGSCRCRTRGSPPRRWRRRPARILRASRPARTAPGCARFSPNSVRLQSTFDTSRNTRGRNPIESSASRLRASVVSVSEPPIR